MFNEFPRIIPVLLLKNKGLYKGQSFKNLKYVGDPINTVKIFNDKEANELLIFEVDTSIKNKKPDIDLLRDIASECFMPLSFGGGVNTLKTIEQIIARCPIFNSFVELYIYINLIMFNTDNEQNEFCSDSMKFATQH